MNCSIDIIKQLQDKTNTTELQFAYEFGNDCDYIRLVKGYDKQISDYTYYDDEICNIYYNNKEVVNEIESLVWNTVGDYRDVIANKLGIDNTYGELEDAAPLGYYGVALITIENDKLICKLEH